MSDRAFVYVSSEPRYDVGAMVAVCLQYSTQKGEKLAALTQPNPVPLFSATFCKDWKCKKDIGRNRGESNPDHSHSKCL